MAEAGYRGVGDLLELPAGRTSDAYLAETDGGEVVVRVPILESGRLLSYWSEQEIGEQLAEAGCPVARWQVVEVDAMLCSIAPRLSGEPISYSHVWSDELAADVAKTLHQFHVLPVSGWGPLVNRLGPLTGASPDQTAGVVDRWFHAQIWPFDGSDLGDHSVTAEADLFDAVRGRGAEILAAACAPFGPVHSDLHRLHLLLTVDRRLGGLLDFGDAFVGSTAWDFALLGWYYGSSNAAAVASHYPGGGDLRQRSHALALAVGLYKWAKNPTDPEPQNRLRQLLLG